MLLPCLTACSGLLGLDDKEFVDPAGAAGSSLAGSGGQPMSGASGQSGAGSAGASGGASGQAGAGGQGGAAGGAAGQGGAAGACQAGMYRCQGNALFVCAKGTGLFEPVEVCDETKGEVCDADQKKCAPGGGGAGGGEPAGGSGGAAGSSAGGAAGAPAGGAAGSSTGGAAGSSAGGAAGSPSGVCAAIYVSPQGDDSQDGCSTSPRRTIGSALKLVSASRSEVRVCSGKYDEALPLDADVTIVGGFDCQSWLSILPDTGNFDPAKADSLLTTRLVNSSKNILGNIDSRARTVQVKGSRQVTLRGLVIRGHAETTATSWAVDASAANVSLTLDRCLLDGGGGQNTFDDGWGSLGLEVGEQSLASVSLSVIRGGSGVAASGVGSVAVLVDKGAGNSMQRVKLDHALIEGGSGQAVGKAGVASAYGSVGVLSLAPIKVTASVVRGGSGSASYGASSVGLFVTTTTSDPLLSVMVSDSEFDGGTGLTLVGSLDDPSSASSYALFGQHVSATVERSRLYGGDPVSDGIPSGNSQAPQAVGVILSGQSTASLTNNVIVGGNQLKKTNSGSSRAVIVTDGSQVTLLHNTLLGGATIGANTNPIALFVGTDSTVNRFENNLLGVSDLSGQGTNSYNIFIAGCLYHRFETFKGNAFLPAVFPLISYDAGPVACPDEDLHNGTLGSFDDVVSAQVSKDVVANQFVKSSCSGVLNCVTYPPCTGASACQQAMFGADISLSQLDQGFPSPAPGLPCSFTQQDKALPDVLTDALGQARQVNTTPGAIQQLSCN